MVFAGPRGKDADVILEYARKSEVPFKYLGKVPYDDLPYLYSACEFFCFPSLYEGFGMPVLEAMKCGSPVIASNVSSIPEILGNNKWLINPTERNSLADKMEEMVLANQQSISEENINKAKEFSWDNHGNRLKKIISKIL